jgi:mevalonate kinase
MTFNTTTYGKWILTGEQAVIRGYPAIVFPLANYQLELRYHIDDCPLKIVTNSKHVDSIAKLWQSAWSNISNKPVQFSQQGRLEIHSNIPIGQGLGASAALCLAISRCVHHFSETPLSTWEFARQLENQFHGQSSGLDVLGSGSHQGIWFEKGQYHHLKLNWQPLWLLTHSQEIGKTAQAVAKVQALFKSNPTHAQALDLQMAHSTHLAAQALKLSQAEGQKKLCESMTLANDCFMQWGLVTDGMQEAIHRLKSLGALAVKPTGSGGGGFLLSLWPSEEKLETLVDEDKHLKIILPTGNKFHSF